MRQACTCIERIWMEGLDVLLMPVVSTGHDTAERASEGVKAGCGGVREPKWIWLRLTKKVTSNLPTA